MEEISCVESTTQDDSLDKQTFSHFFNLLHFVVGNENLLLYLNQTKPNPKKVEVETRRSRKVLFRAFSAWKSVSTLFFEQISEKSIFDFVLEPSRDGPFAWKTQDISREDTNKEKISREKRVIENKIRKRNGMGEPKGKPKMSGKYIFDVSF